MTTKVRNKGAQRAILKRLLQLHVDHSTIVDGLSLADVSTTLNLSRAETEAHVETHISEGYLYSTIDTDHYKTTCDEMPSDEQLSSLAAAQGPQRSAPSATAPSRQQPAPWLRRELAQSATRIKRGSSGLSGGGGPLRHLRRRRRPSRAPGSRSCPPESCALYQFHLYLVATTRTPYLNRSAAARRRRAGAWRSVLLVPPRRRAGTGGGSSRGVALADLTQVLEKLKICLS